MLFYLCVVLYTTVYVEGTSHSRCSAITEDAGVAKGTNLPRRWQALNSKRQKVNVSTLCSYEIEGGRVPGIFYTSYQPLY